MATTLYDRYFAPVRSGFRRVYDDYMARPRVSVYESAYVPPEGVQYGQAPWYMRYFDQMYGKTRKKEKSIFESPWLWVLGGVAVLALLVYRAKAATAEADDSGSSGAGGYYESLGGGSEDTGSSGSSGVPTVPDGSTLPGVPTLPGQAEQQVSSGSALTVFEDAYSGAQFATGDTVYSLHGDAVKANRVTAGNPYGSVQLGYLNPDTLNEGYGQRTDVTGLAEGLGVLPVDYSGAGWATYWNVDEAGNRTVEVRDGRLYVQNYDSAASEVFSSPAFSGMSLAEKNQYAASVALGRSLESVGQLDTMGAADRARYESYKSMVGSATSAQQTARVAAAKQSNASLAAKQAEEKAAQQAAQQQAALAAQQAAQASKSSSSGSSGSRSSGGSSGGSRIVGRTSDSGVYVTNKGGKTGNASLSSVIGSLGKYTSKSGSSSKSSSSGSSRGSSGGSSWSGGGGGLKSGVKSSGSLSGGGSYVDV